MFYLVLSYFIYQETLSSLLLFYAPLSWNLTCNPHWKSSLWNLRDFLEAESYFGANLCICSALYLDLSIPSFFFLSFREKKKLLGPREYYKEEKDITSPNSDKNSVRILFLNLVCFVPCNRILLQMGSNCGTPCIYLM